MRKCQKDDKKILAKQALNPAAFDNILRLNEGYWLHMKMDRFSCILGKCEKDVFAMIRQLGILTWFCSMTSAKTKWNSLFKILSKLLNNGELSDEEIFELSWTDKYKLIKKIPVTCLGYFHYRFQVFMEKTSKSSLNTLDKIVHFLFLIEFQQRVSPYIHILLWTENVPILRNDNNEIETFIDNHCKCSKNENYLN